MYKEAQALLSIGQTTHCLTVYHNCRFFIEQISVRTMNCKFKLENTRSAKQNEVCAKVRRRGEWSRWGGGAGRGGRELSIFSSIVNSEDSTEPTATYKIFILGRERKLDEGLEIK